MHVQSPWPSAAVRSGTGAPDGFAWLAARLRCYSPPRYRALDLDRVPPPHRPRIILCLVGWLERSTLICSRPGGSCVAAWKSGALLPNVRSGPRILAASDVVVRQCRVRACAARSCDNCMWPATPAARGWALDSGPALCHVCGMCLAIWHGMP